MEQSKLISVIIANFKVAYPYYFTKLSDEEFLGLVGIYQEYFGKFNGNALMRAVKKIIKKEKFMQIMFAISVKGFAIIVMWGVYDADIIVV